MKNKLLIFSSILVLLTITILSLLPPKEMSMPTNDKVGHFLAYAALSLNLLLWMRDTGFTFYILLFSILYGGLMEFFQGFVPGREQSFLDMAANASGVLIGYFIFWLLHNQIIKFLTRMRLIG